MTKRVITLLVAILMVTTLLVGCKKTETINSEKSETDKESYKLFRTDDVQEYLNFLENFDETKYEIVDISVNDGGAVTDEWYFVTYKQIAE